MGISAEVFDERICALGEGPTYDEIGDRAVWVDIIGKRVLWRSLSGDQSGEVAVPAHVGAAVPRTDGRFEVLLADTIAIVDLDSGALEPDFGWPAKHTDVPFAIRSNDAKADPQGRLYFGSMPYDHNTYSHHAALYLRADGQSSIAIDNVGLSNGLGWSPDGQTMYYIDTKTFRVDAFSVDPDGALTNRRPFVELARGGPGPDGMCVDSEGGVWVALWGAGRVQRYLPDGTAAEHIDVPGLHSSSCAFVGTDLDLMIITTATEELEPDQLDGAGITYCARPGVTGLPTNRFLG